MPRRSRSSSIPRGPPTGTSSSSSSRSTGPTSAKSIVGSDYRSEIFYTSDEQRQVAEDTIADVDAAGLWPGKVVTKISEAGPFWEAEAEDQDYLQHYPGGSQFPQSRLAGAGHETAG